MFYLFFLLTASSLPAHHNDADITIIKKIFKSIPNKKIYYEKKVLCEAGEKLTV
jgi:hypothetical protein